MATERQQFADQVGAEFIAGMEELIATAKAGGLAAVKRKYASRVTPALAYDLPVVAGGDVAAARKALGVSQPIFAKILGASVQSVRAWEQGTKPPSGVARRLIGEIRHDPEYWRKRFVPKPAAVA